MLLTSSLNYDKREKKELLQLKCIRQINKSQQTILLKPDCEQSAVDVQNSAKAT